MYDDVLKIVESLRTNTSLDTLILAGNNLSDVQEIMIEEVLVKHEISAKVIIRRDWLYENMSDNEPL